MYLSKKNLLGLFCVLNGLQFLSGLNFSFSKTPYYFCLSCKLVGLPVLLMWPDLHHTLKLQLSSNTSEENRKWHFITSGVVCCKVKVGVCLREKVFATHTLFPLWACERTSVSRDIIKAIYTDTKSVHVELVQWRVKLQREQGKPLDFRLISLPYGDTFHSPRLGKKFRSCIPFSFVNHNCNLEE